MKREQAQEMIELLASEYHVVPPQLTWTNRAKNGRYFPRTRRICIGPRVWRGVVDCLLHEFAHHLYYVRKLYARTPHGRAYHVILTDVVTRWYGDVKSYQWTTEYQSIRGPAQGGK